MSKFIKVNSTVIHGVRRVSLGLVEIAFVNGTTKSFKRMTDAKVQELLNSRSVGRFFNMAIRNNPIHQV